MRVDFFIRVKVDFYWGEGGFFLNIGVVFHQGEDGFYQGDLYVAGCRQVSGLLCPCVPHSPVALKGDKSVGFSLCYELLLQGLIPLQSTQAHRHVHATATALAQRAPAQH